ncbi:MAG: bifunctional oligoribonuclease/PAP phosphatase NrnA [Patescibacteria group bacterium]
MSQALRQIAQKILSADTITIILHRQPDGDAIGSAVALAESLAEKDLKIATSPKIDEIYSRVIDLPPTTTRLDLGRDCYLVLDCSESHRTGFTEQLRAVPGKNIIVIDHHTNRGDLVKVTKNFFIDESYSATAEIVDDLLKLLRKAITPKICTALLLGIYTDTGGFKHPNTSQKTLERASKLIRQGGDLRKITKTFLQKSSNAKRKLWGKMLSNLEINRWGIAQVRVTKKQISDSGARAEDIFGIANTIALISEAKAALVMIEQDDGWRGILRTRHRHIDIGRLAKLLGGTGQKKAAGFTATNKVFSGKIDN